MSSKPKQLPATVLRIVDVNANRATEGLRVVEEYLRFEWQDAGLSARCKSIRHKVSKTVAAMVSASARVACRSTDTDVGTQVQGDTEYQRAATQDIALANFRRVTESLRVLEEYGKLASVEIAQQFESLRYETYTLEKSLGHLYRGEDAMSDARLYVLIDDADGFGDVFWNRYEQLLESEVDMVQLRAKDTPDRQLADVACRLSDCCRTAGKLFIVNDRADIARIAHADGVHVGQNELSPAEARSILGADKLIGVSTHSIQQAQQAIRDGADYIGVGPVFPSTDKTIR